MSRKQNRSQMLLSAPLSMTPSQLLPRFFPTSDSAPLVVCKNSGKCYQCPPHSCNVLLPYLKALLQVSQWETRSQRLRWYQLSSQWSSRGQNFVYFKRQECHSTQMSQGHAQSPPPSILPGNSIHNSLLAPASPDSGLFSVPACKHSEAVTFLSSYSTKT